MFITKKARRSALLEIANSEVLESFVQEFAMQSKGETYGWLKDRTYHKKDKGVREIVVGDDFVQIRPVLRGYEPQKGLAYGMESSGFDKIAAHRNHKGRVIVSQKRMIKLFAEEFAAQFVMGELGMAYKPRGFSRSESESLGKDVVIVKYNTKVLKK